MIGTIVNAAAVVVGGSIGLLVKHNLSPRLKTIFFQAIGLFTIAIGITMVSSMQHILIIVASVALGALIGEWLKLDVHIQNVSEKLKIKLKIGNDQFTTGLVTAFLLYCTGSMTIIGSINEGLGLSSDLLYTKSLMDGFSSIILASAFGTGVIVSAIPLFLLQAAITLIAKFFGNFLSQDIINGMGAVGGILLIGTGINILDIKSLRVINMLPALLLVIVLMLIFL